MSHFWVSDPDENMIVCANCDTYRGARASHHDICAASDVNPIGQHCDGCGLHRAPFDGRVCDWCEDYMLTLQAEHEAAAR